MLVSKTCSPEIPEDLPILSRKGRVSRTEGRFIAKQ